MHVQCTRIDSCIYANTNTQKNTKNQYSHTTTKKTKYSLPALEHKTKLKCFFFYYIVTSAARSAPPFFFTLFVCLSHATPQQHPNIGCCLPYDLTDTFPLPAYPSQRRKNNQSHPPPLPIYSFVFCLQLPLFSPLDRLDKQVHDNSHLDKRKLKKKKSKKRQKNTPPPNKKNKQTKERKKRKKTRRFLFDWRWWRIYPLSPQHTPTPSQPSPPPHPTEDAAVRQLKIEQRVK